MSFTGCSFSVSRTPEEAAREPEWPGRPVRKLRQTRLWQPAAPPGLPRDASPSLRLAWELDQRERQRAEAEEAA